MWPVHCTARPPGLGIGGEDGSLGVTLPSQKVWQPLSWPSSWGGRQEARAQCPCGHMTCPWGQLGIKEVGLCSFLMELHGPGGRGWRRRWETGSCQEAGVRLSAMVTGFCNTTLGSSREIGGWRAAVEAGGCPLSQLPAGPGPALAPSSCQAWHIPHEVVMPQEAAQPASL